MKKIISILLAIITVMLPATAYAYAGEKTSDNQARFKSVSGTVKEIKKSETDKNVTYVLLDLGKENEAYLVINEDTYFIDDEEIYIGSQVTGYYDANAMMIMIYPPQYAASVVAVSNKDINLKVDLFDKNLVSADNMLKLVIGSNTKVVTKDGKEFKGDLANRKLAVFYRSSAKSLPAQTTPDKVVVLSDPIVPDEDKSSYFGAFKGTVTKIRDMKGDKNKTQLTLKDKEGLEAKFIVSKDTYRTNNEKISVGSVVTGYYDAKVFRIMIYPLEYEAVVLDVERPEYKIKVDYFDNKLTSADKSLKLKIGKDTEIIYMDGTEYKGNPVKTNLVVIYDKTDKSKPAQTEPVKVIVLEKKNSKDNKKNAQDKEYWKSKLDEWMKLTDEIIKNLDKMSEYKNTFYKYITENLNKLKTGFSLTDLLKYTKLK